MMDGVVEGHEEVEMDGEGYGGMMQRRDILR